MVNKIVNSSELDTNLTNIANAIRTKGGTSAALEFPGGFVDAISEIKTENLDTELSTQATLLSEQDAKIAELAEVLATKAGGGAALETASVFVNLLNDTALKYIGENGLTHIANAAYTVKVVVPSLCFIQAPSYFSDFSVDGDATTIYYNNTCAVISINGTTNITAIAFTGPSGGVP